MALALSHVVNLGGLEFTLLLPLLFAFLLSSLVGIERQMRAKDAGVRTHTLVGTGAALFVLVSAYGFSSVLGDHVVLDPSRVAAQIVSGIGFLGAGLIFVRRDSVRGLTTAASIWVTAAIGSACGAGLPVLAAATTGAYFIVTLAYPVLMRRFLGFSASGTVRLTYTDGYGVLRQAMTTSTSRGWLVEEVSVDREEDRESDGARVAMVALSVRSRRPGGSVEELIETLSGLPGVIHVGRDYDLND